MRIGENSSASVIPEPTGRLTLDQLSRGKLDLRGGSIKPILTEGALLLDVQEKQDANEDRHEVRFSF